MIIDASRVLLAGAVLAFGLVGCASGPKQEAPPPAAAPAPPAYVVKGVNFATDSAKLSPKANAILDEAAAGVKGQPGVHYEVAGYTDSVGSDKHNQGLSDRRAKAVKDGLVHRGVSAQQLTTRGYGESNPIASNATAAGRAENRRVEIRPAK